MTNDARHRIRRAVFDVRFPDEPTAFRVRGSLEALFERVVTPTLARIFDRHAPNGREHRIDRLEVDLGQLRADRLDEDRIRRLIETQVSRALDRIVADPAADRRDRVRQLVETLAVFLDRGRFPWSSDVDSPTQLETELLKIVPAAAVDQASRLREVLAHRRARRRLADQLGIGLFEWIVAVLAPAIGADLVRRLSDVLRSTRGVDARLLILEHLVAAHGSPPPSAASVESLVRENAPGASSRLASRASEPPVADDVFAPDESAPDRAAPADEGTPEDAVYVRLAGIVLLHPFLERLFDKLGLLAPDRRFASNDARLEAIQLLYHLATGDEHAEEHELTLLKVLCGVPDRTPVPAHPPLGSAAKDEAGRLLAAVVRHWARLGSTSPAALRETFFLRDGRLVRAGDGWKLGVERRGVDVLLESLPWGLSVIRLPWMRHVLWIEWT